MSAVARGRKLPAWSPLLLVLAAGCDGGTVAVDWIMSSPATVAVGPLTATLSAVGDTLRLTARVTDQYGQALAAVPVAWSVDPPDVAGVDSTGLLTARSNGTATVTATAAAGVSGSATVTVAQTVAAVEVAPGSATMTALGDTLRLTAKASDANGHAMASVPVVWSVDPPDVAVVDSTGLLTARSNGTATVTAAAGVSGSATVTVAQAVAAVEVDPAHLETTALGVGRIGETLWARVTDANGHAVSGVPVVWSSDADSVAAVESAGKEVSGGPGVSIALVTPGWEGTATVRATAAAVVSGSAVVTVLSPHCVHVVESGVECSYDVLLGRSPVWDNPEVITPDDPSRLDSVAYAGTEGENFLFTAHFGSHTMNATAARAYATADSARADARFFASAIGRLPRFLIHGGRGMHISPAPSYGASASSCGDTFFWEGTRSSWDATTGAGTPWPLERASGSVEEVALHEAGHVVLDSCWGWGDGGVIIVDETAGGFSLSPGWLAAQEADGMFISGYAKANPRREDVAETLWAWFVSRCVPDRLHPAWKWYIDRGIPHRLVFMDRVFAAEGFDTSPYTCGVGS